MLESNTDTDLDSLDQDYIDKGTQDAEDYANEGTNTSDKQPSTRHPKTRGKETTTPQKPATKGQKKSPKHLPSPLPKKPKNLEEAGKEAAKELFKKTAFALIFNPLFLVILAIIIILLFIFFLIFVGDSDLKKQAQADSLTISKSGPSDAQVGQTLTYQIAVNYALSAEDVTITDKLPEGTDYVSSNPAGTYNPTSRTVTWSAKALSLPLTGPIVINITLTLKATQNNLNIVNIAQATVTGSGGGAIPAGYVPPTTDNCGGKYKLTSPLKKNFGDPACNFSKDQLYTLLKQQDAGRADIWFNKVVPCESGYNPNAYAGPQTGTPDARGAWGLYQMGSSSPPGSPPPAPGKNGPNDRGDVDWYTQTINATTYGKKLSNLGSYWACAR